MSLQADKLRLIQLLINTENQSVIDRVKEVFHASNEKDIWLDLTEAQQVVINDSIKESVSGKTIEYDRFLAEHMKWVGEYYSLKPRRRS